MRNEIAQILREASEKIRNLPDFTHEDMKAAQSAAQAAASLEEAIAKKEKQAEKTE